MLERDLDPEGRSHIIDGAQNFTGITNHSYDAPGKPIIDWWGLAKSFIALIEIAERIICV